MKHVILVGATDGIGLALARAYLDGGWRVGILGRSAGKTRRVVEGLRDEHPDATVRGGLGDVSQADRLEDRLEALLRHLGQMDLLVYSAGVLRSPDPEGRVSAGDVVDTVAVNVTGAMITLEWAAAYFRELGRGHVAALGSVAGARGRGGNPVYTASKAGLHQYMEGLRHRLHGSGVRVTTVVPGYVRTRLLGPDPPSFPPPVEPERAAALIRRGLERGREHFHVPGWWAPVSWILRRMPRFLFKRLGPE